ncbi:Nn.00g077630.m01.CDS01 [Neocucurbitaria sp. VM-36]
MSLQSAADVPLLISSPNSSSERRISPSWSIAQLKTRLEPITGVPASSQQLSLRLGSQDAIPLTAADEEQTRLVAFPLQPYAEIRSFLALSFISLPVVLIRCLARTQRPSAAAASLLLDAPQYPSAAPTTWVIAGWGSESLASSAVSRTCSGMGASYADGSSSRTHSDFLPVVDTRPPAARTDFTDLSSVEKYEMPTTEYESRTDSVLAWKKAQKLGRFDPDAGTIEQQKIRASEREVEERSLTLSSRVRLLPETDARRGTISYIGLVPEIPGLGSWIGVTLDEPTGKNDGSVKGKRYFECGNNYGVFVRPERCEAGDFPPLDMGDEDLEEL